MTEAAPAPEEIPRAWLERAGLSGSPRHREVLRARLDLPWFDGLEQVPADLATLFVVGGGTRLDEAKHWRAHHRPGLRLIAIATLWGSGAEVSPVVALTRAGGKHIEIDEALRPDGRLRWPELAASVPEERARDACGDVWAHAFEGFASPLADDALRDEGAALLARLAQLDLGPGRDVRAWFEASEDACRLQARSSVGLVHGLAHTLEIPASSAADPAPLRRTHAGLCALCLAPVLALDRHISDTLEARARAHGLDLEAVARAATALHDAEAWAALLPEVRARWRDVLRDPCTRTNVALVRPAHLELLEAWRP